MLVLVLPRAGLADEREFQLAVEPLYGFVYAATPALRGISGGGGALHLSYGLSDAVSLRLSGGATAHPVSPGDLLLAWNASLGVVYALDVVRIVPFFEASLGLLGQTMLTPGGNATDLHFALGVGLGGDYLVTRHFAIGVVVRYQVSLLHPELLPLYLTTGLRMVVRF